MFIQIKRIFQTIGKENRFKSLILLLILLMVIILELLNFSLIIPILSIVFENTGQDYKFLSYIRDNLGLEFDNILIIGAVFILILLIKIFALLFFEYMVQKFSRELNIDISLKAYSFFLYAPWQEVFKRDHGYIMRNIFSDAGAFVSEGVIKIIELFKNTLLLTFILGYLFFVNFKATLVILILLTLFVVMFLLFFKKKFLKLSELSQSLLRYRYKNILESVINLRDIKLTTSAEYFLELFKINENKISKVVIANAVINKLPRYSLELLIVIFIFIFLVFFNFKNLNMIEMIPILGLYGFAAVRLIPIFAVYNQSLQAMRIHKYQIDEVIKNAGRFSVIFKERSQSLESTKKINIEEQKLQINIDNLNFEYDSNNKIFENVHLKIDKDQTIFVEGPNGSGKSTLVDLLSGMLKPSEGRIEINGEDLNSLKDIWKSKIGYVSQSNFLIDESIKNNIIFGRKNILEEDVKNVCKIVGLNKFINSLPNGIETNVGNLGSYFSGGQKQKISIARALVKNPKFIILDEATNALDIESEKEFLEIINKIKKNKIIIFIAHSKIIKDFCDINLMIKNKKIIRVNNEKS
tara:strand:- start:671 stop:2413 length:1743 start_codon:yes stop_codon:yes gene_type:complete